MKVKYKLVKKVKRMENNMKLKKLALIIVATLITISIFSVCFKAYANTSGNIGSMYLDITMFRSSGYGYKALEKNIWKIIETNSSGTTKDYSKTIYCLKGGPGFGSGAFGSGDTEHRHYTRYFDMKNPSEIPSPYINALPDTTSATYKSLIWLLEHVYVAPKTNATPEEIQKASEYKSILMQEANVGTYITDDDIDAVQQLAVWHFTNNDTYKIADGGTFEFAINALPWGDTYNAMSEKVNENGWDRATECQALYDYLVNTATAMGNNSTPTIVSLPYEMANLTSTTQENGENIVIGPIRINKLNNIFATLSGEFKFNGSTITPILQDINGTPFNTLQDTVGKEFYIVVPKTMQNGEIVLDIVVSYFDTTLTYWSVQDAPQADQPVVVVDRIKNQYPLNWQFTLEQEPEEEIKMFDLALRKYIISINGKNLDVSREPQISSETIADLRNNRVTTVQKIHPKNALEVKTGDKVVYKIRVYNEGDIDAYVNEIIDYLPDGLKLAENSTINTNNNWKNPLNDGKTMVTDKLSGTLLKAFDGTNLKYVDVEIECEVTATVKETDILLKNIAEITRHSDANLGLVIDRDSTPNNVNKANYSFSSQEDDDDFEQLILRGKYFDLSLRKFIQGVGDEDFILDSGKYMREPVVDVTPLLNGQTTAIYNHDKTPINVNVGDEVIYIIRVYNEGQIAGYVNEITDYLPEYLEFVNDEFNASYGWKLSSDGRTVITTITSPDTEFSANRDTIFADRKQGNDKVILDAFDSSTQTLDYIDVKIKCKVKDTGLAQKLTNIAEISRFTDLDGNIIVDRDSQSNNITLPADSVLPNYKDAEINRGDSYILGQQDDDDFEKVIVQKFDLALRKFITSVNEVGITNRIPIFSTDSQRNYSYSHTKTPVEVATGDIVIYTLRIYNEGNQSGYASEIRDDLPDGLQYLPEHEINVQYRWKLYNETGEETFEVAEAKEIRTDYLSKVQEAINGRENIIKAFDTENMTLPDYKEVKVAFKVTEPNTSDRIIINTAEISEDTDELGNKVEDIDSIPDNNIDGEDDIDIEKVRVKYFDLSLRKIVSKVNMTVDGKTSEILTKHEFDVEPEPIVKLELGNHKIKTAVIKYTYQIRVMNEGEVAGYVKELKDYIPEGLEFVQEDNLKWQVSEDGKIATTDQLKDTLLQPGETAIVEIVLKWINGQDNLGVKTNVAEISIDYNDHDDTNDIDSTPDNYKEGEDDIDDATVLLSIVTGATENYTILVVGVLAILSTGIILIKKFVI